MKNYSLPEETLVKVLNYLGKRPYVETSVLIQEVQSKAKLVSDESAAQAAPSAEEQTTAAATN